MFVNKKKKRWTHPGGQSRRMEDYLQYFSYDLSISKCVKVNIFQKIWVGYHYYYFGENIWCASWICANELGKTRILQMYIFDESALLVLLKQYKSTTQTNSFMPPLFSCCRYIIKLYTHNFSLFKFYELMYDVYQNSIFNFSFPNISNYW